MNSQTCSSSSSSLSIPSSHGKRGGIHRLWRGNGHRSGSIWDQGKNRAPDDDPNAQPEPHHQRVKVSLEDRFAGRVLPFVDKVKVLFQRGADRGHSLRLLAGLVKAALRIESVDLTSVLFNVDDGPLAGIVRLVFLRVRAADQGISADGQLVAEAQRLLFILIEGSARQSDDDYYDAEVDDVSTITAGIAVGQLHHGGEHVLARVLGNDAAAPVKLGGYGQRDQHG